MTYSTFKCTLNLGPPFPQPTKASANQSNNTTAKPDCLEGSAAESCCFSCHSAQYIKSGNSDSNRSLGISQRPPLIKCSRAITNNY